MHKKQQRRKPLFLTQKMKVRHLSRIYNFYDFQLRDHLMTNEDVFLGKCKCIHTHAKTKCKLRSTPVCKRCNEAHEKYIDYKSLKFHHDVKERKLAKCKCTHIHVPPCYNCIGCKTLSNCIIQEPFECNFTTDVICDCKGVSKFTQTLPYTSTLYNHMYNTRTPVLYVCKSHQHIHAHDSPYLYDKTCVLQSNKCCKNAVLLTDLNSSFIISICLNKTKELDETNPKNNTKKPKKNSLGKVVKEIVICTPRFWKEQAYNRFVSLLDGIVLTPPQAKLPQIIKNRYERFQESSFKISNLKKYCSGKQSMVRTHVTGFETKGIYQTAIISCTIPINTVIIPQRLYDVMQNRFDLDFVMLKRDPSVTPTCMFVRKCIRNEDPECETIIIPDTIAKPLNQDQDGDKNGIYFLPLINQLGYSLGESYIYKVSKLEVSIAYENDKSLTGIPRDSFSEYGKLMIYRNAKELEQESEFFRRTKGYGPEYMINAGCYLKELYDDFCTILRTKTRENDGYCLTVDDYALGTDTLESIVKSGSKGHLSTLRLLFDNLRNSKTLNDTSADRIEQMNKYITSGQNLRESVRNLFTLLYACIDLISIFGVIYLNKLFFADFKACSFTYTFSYNEASLNEFVKDLENLPD